MPRSRTGHATHRAPGRTAGTGAPSRRLSLDVFRGVAAAAMVIVNTQGDWDHVYPPLRHAAWDGWTPADLICSFFLFCVGISITMSPRIRSARSTLRRAAVLIAIGLFLGGFPAFDVAQWRIPGVLQRIGLCYFAAACAVRVTTGDRRRRGAILMSVAVYLAIAYWLVMLHVPAGDGIAGDLSPEGNLAACLDRMLMSGHLLNPGWDPDGLLGTMSAISTTLFGAVAGLCLASGETEGRKAGALAAAGAGAVVMGEMLSVVFPINRSLWSSSYNLFTVGIASIWLAALYWTVEVKGWRGWTKPFATLGANALTLFIASALLTKTLTEIAVGKRTPLREYAYQHYFGPVASPRNASLLYAAANLAVLFTLLAWMYRRRLFIRA